jgi:hypothetical protein
MQMQNSHNSHDSFCNACCVFCCRGLEEWGKLYQHALNADNSLKCLAVYNVIMTTA